MNRVMIQIPLLVETPEEDLEALVQEILDLQPQVA
jgi:hypothetical protein